MFYKDLWSGKLADVCAPVTVPTMDFKPGNILGTDIVIANGGVLSACGSPNAKVILTGDLGSSGGVLTEIRWIPATASWTVSPIYI